MPGWGGTGITGPVNSSETACYDSGQVMEPGDGFLHLHLIMQQANCKGNTRPYTGSLVSSDGKFQYTYGYVEFRAYLPSGLGGVIANWPADGEFDTMEGLGGQGCYHFHSPAGGPGGCGSGSYSGWHTFGSDWEPGVVTYYYDGVQVGQITNGITSSPQYLIIDNTTNSSSPTSVPADMMIDYVRVWQKCTTNCSTNTPATSNPSMTPTVPTCGCPGGTNCMSTLTLTSNTFFALKMRRHIYQWLQF